MKELFYKFSEINIDSENVIGLLQSNDIDSISIHVLGPEGTNINCAAHRWAEHYKIADKSAFILCCNPAEEIELASKIKTPDVFPVFALCAVYDKLHDLYFKNPSMYFFMHHYYMPLDNMRLSTNHEVPISGRIPTNWKIASHPSPSSLLANLENNISLVDSNSMAAQKCALNECDACITTKSAEEIYDLKTIHEYGSPNMLFTFGTTEHGIDIFNRILKRKGQCNENN